MGMTLADMQKRMREMALKRQQGNVMRPAVQPPVGDVKGMVNQWQNAFQRPATPVSGPIKTYQTTSVQPQPGMVKTAVMPNTTPVTAPSGQGNVYTTAVQPTVTATSAPTNTVTTAAAPAPPKSGVPLTDRDKQLIREKALAGQQLSNPTAEKNQYYQQVLASAGQPKGWGVGYAADNVSGGFAGYNDPTALNQEIARMETVIANRQKAGMGINAEQNYLNTLKQYNEPYAPIDTDKYKTEEATIDDIAKKYGFDFSREYANRQAEAEAQARRNANTDAQRRNTTNRDENMKAIDNNLMNMADSLDRNYFLQGLNQAQGQVESGLNAGIAADQDLRMAMARQANMGEAYRDANLGRMQENNRFTNDDLRLAEELGLINQQALAREDQLFNDRLQMGFDNAMSLNNFRQADNQNLLNAAIQQRGQSLDYNKFSRGLEWDKRMFGSVSATDQARLAQERYMFNNMSADQQAQNRLAYSQLNEQKRQFNSEADWRRYTYNNMSATDKAQMDEQIRQFGEEMAWRDYEMKYMANIQLGIAQAGAGMGYGSPGYVFPGPAETGSISPFPAP